MLPPAKAAYAGQCCQGFPAAEGGLQHPKGFERLFPRGLEGFSQRVWKASPKGFEAIYFVDLGTELLGKGCYQS